MMFLLPCMTTRDVPEDNGLLGICYGYLLAAVEG